MTSDHGMLGVRSMIKIRDFIDGTSNTILLGEQSDELRDASNNIILGNAYSGPVGISVTTMGSDKFGMGCPIVGYYELDNFATIRYRINQICMTFNAGGCHDNVGTNIPLSSMHVGGAHLLLADGAVRFASNSMYLQTLYSAASRDDGKVVQMG